MKSLTAALALSILKDDRKVYGSASNPKVETTVDMEDGG